VFIPSEVRIETQWSRGGGFDFGIGAPTACVYGAISPDMHVWIYEEDYEANADIPKFAKNIRRRGFDYVCADPSVVSRGPTKKSPKDLYAECNVSLIPAPNDIDFFISLVTQLLRQERLHISVRCKHLIDQIKQAAWNPSTIAGTSLKEMMKVMENHAVDAFKYFINVYGMYNGRMDAILPGANKIIDVPKFIHPSYAEDKDFYKPNYVHGSIRDRILGGNDVWR
jgi:hypothetical protein